MIITRCNVQTINSQLSVLLLRNAWLQSVQTLIILHPVNSISEVAGEKDGGELHHTKPQDPGGHVAPVVYKDVLHDRETALGEDMLAVLGVAGLGDDILPVRAVGDTAALELLLDVVPGLRHTGVASLVVVLEASSHVHLDTLGQIVLQHESSDAGSKLSEEDDNHQA